MPPKKRNRMIDTMTPPTSARRSTRVSRTSTGGASTGTTSSRRKGNSRHHHHTFTASTSDKPAKRWAQVLRPPKPGVGFKTLKWVPVDQMTMIERNVYDEEELEKKKRKEMEAVVVTNKRINGQKLGEGIGDCKDGRGEKVGEKEVKAKEAGPSTEAEPNTLDVTVKENKCNSEDILHKEISEDKSIANTPSQLNQSDEMGSIIQKPRIDEGPQSLQPSSQNEATMREAVSESNTKEVAAKDCSSGEISSKETNEGKSIAATSSQPEISDEMERTAKKPRIDAEPAPQQSTTEQEIN